MNKISVIVLASGLSKRFNGNKLLHLFNGKPMIEYTFEKLKQIDFDKVLVVSRYSEVLNLAKCYGFTGIKNNDETFDTSITIKLGIDKIKNTSIGAMLIVADEPYLKIESLNKLPEEPNDDNPDKTIILFRFPDGETTKQRKFLANNTINDLIKFKDKELIKNV